MQRDLDGKEDKGRKTMTSLLDRTWQPKVVQRILDCVRTGKNRIMLDAPTGSGKTLIALLALMEIRREYDFHSYIAVRTINEMFPYDRDIAGFKIPLDYKYFVGKRRACSYYVEGDDNNSALCDACLLRKFNKQTREEEFDEDNARRVIRSAQVRSELPSGLANLERKYVKNKDAQICLYHSLKEITSDADLITFPYIINENIRNATKIDLSKSIVIVDEAHNLENAGDVSHHISVRSLDASIRDFRENCLPLILKNDSEDWAVQVESAMLKLSKALVKISPERSEELKGKHIEKLALVSEIDDEGREIISEAYSEVELLKRRLAEEKSNAGLRNPFYAAHSFLSNIDNESYELFSEGSGNISLKVVDPASTLSILNESRVLLLMSGTMPPADYVQKVWGIEGCEEIRVSKDYDEDYHSVFPRRSRKVEVIDGVSSAYNQRKGEDWIRRYVEIIQSAFKLGSLSTLVCCPSYSIASKINNELRVEKKYLETRATSVQEVMDVLGSRLIILAVARGKILEGVEFVKNGASLIDSVVVAGVPYPVPDDLYKWRVKKIMSRLGVSTNEFRYFMQIPALTVVKQAIGRAIRFPADTVSVYLADSRFRDPLFMGELS